MLKKLFLFVSILLAYLLLTGCSNDKFEIEGALSDAGTKNIRVVYMNEAGVQSSWIPVEKGRFKLVGVSADYTVISIYNHQREFITRTAVKNGDNVKIRGTIKHNHLIEMKGNDVSKEWSEFRRENHRLYEEDDKIHALDKKIEKYIEENGDKITSLLLLLYDYSNINDIKKVHQLLGMIEEKSRPASIMQAYTEMNAELSKKSKRKTYHSMMFFNPKDSLESFVPLRSKVSVMCFWGINDDDRKENIDSLNNLYEDYKGKKQLQIADIMMDSDTSRWKKALRREDTPWKHYWVVGGIMNKSIADLQIKKTPTFIVIDSIGESIYIGDSISKVTSSVRERLVKSNTNK